MLWVDIKIHSNILKGLFFSYILIFYYILLVRCLLFNDGHVLQLRSEIVAVRYGHMRKATGSYRYYPSLVKLQPEFLSLRWKICLWAELQLWILSLQRKICRWIEMWPWFLHLLWKTCIWTEHTDDVLRLRENPGKILCYIKLYCIILLYYYITLHCILLLYYRHIMLYYVYIIL